MTKIGDQIRCPQCCQIGRVVWVSEDGKLAGMQCSGHHSQLSNQSKFGSAIRPQPKSKKNMVLFMEIETATTPMQE